MNIKKISKKNETEKMAVEKVETQSKKPKKTVKLTKKTLVIIASVCVVLIVSAIAIPLGIIFGNAKTDVEPYFESFDDNSDYYIRVKWNKVRGASGYSYVYYYGNVEDAKESELKVCKTQNNVTVLPRHKGKVSVKVKADIPGETTRYSNWITIEVKAWKLLSPIVTIGKDLDVSWVPSTFKADDQTYNVTDYVYTVLINGEEKISDNPVKDNVLDLKSYVIRCVKDLVEPVNLDEWEDVTFTVKVKARAYYMFAGTKLPSPDKPYDVLTNVYDDSEYGEQTFVITNEIYNQLK